MSGSISLTPFWNFQGTSDAAGPSLWLASSGALMRTLMLGLGHSYSQKTNGGTESYTELSLLPKNWCYKHEVKKMYFLGRKNDLKLEVSNSWS